MKIRVLFLSTYNACRSQMAEGLVNHFLGDRITAFSAGSLPRSVNPKAVAVMSEIGIDISRQYSKAEEGFLEERFDYVITLCGDSSEKCLFNVYTSYCGRCGQDCPHLEQTSHGVKRLYMLGFADPTHAAGDEEEIMAEFRAARDLIKAKLIQFFE